MLKAQNSPLFTQVFLDVLEALGVLFLGAHGDAEDVSHLRLRADDGALCLEELEGVHRVLEAADGDEVCLALHVGETHFFEALHELFESLLVLFADEVHEFLVVDGGASGHLGDTVHVERVADAVDEADDFGAGDAVAHAEAGEAVNLTEGAAADDVLAFVDAAAEVRSLVFDEFGVGFVHHEDASFREAVGEVQDFLGGEVTAGRVVRVREEHETSLVVHGGAHGLEVALECRGGHRDFDDVGIGGHGGELVHGEGMLAHDGVAVRTEEDFTEHGEDFVTAVADCNLFALHAAEFCNLSDEVVGAAIGVEVHGFQVFACGGHSLGARAERVFVTGELVHVFRVEAEFTGGIGDRFAGHIDGLLQNVLLSKRINVHNIYQWFVADFSLVLLLQ